MLEEKNDNLPQAEGQEQITQEETAQITNQSAIEAIESSNAEESEDESISEGHDIPMLNYESMSMEELTSELHKLVTNEKLLSIRNHVEEIKKEFIAKYHHFIEEKRDEYSHENNGDTSGFEYHFPLKHKFDSIYNLYKDQKNQHFKQMQNSLKHNLDVRLAIIEELKNVIDNSGENMQEMLKTVNELRDRWKNAGPIPRDKYNHVWNNFHFHIERFYDHLHLDREARDLDFKHNYELKSKIIARVEELVNEEDVPKAFRELQSLHKIWKEEIGPVSREHREELWNRFSELTKQLHDKREAIFAKAREIEVENLAKKKEIIAQIEAIANEQVAAHSAWQGQIERIEALRSAFMKAGKVPLEVNEATWTAFKDAVRNFNAHKNAFYKDIKKDQQDNLNKKMALVEKAKSLQESDDFNVTTPIMKQIQEEWKKIGHVPKKYSDSVWKDFKDACNHYFDRMHEKRNEVSNEELEAFDKKKEYLDTLKDFQLTGDHKTDLDAIKKHIETWKSFGKVPHVRRHIEGKFNKILDALFDKLSLSKKDAEMAKFSNRLEQLTENEDTRQLQNEQIYIMRKIEEMQGEIIQLENNIQFISSGKKTKGENPFVREVQKSIDRHKEELKTWKEKLKQIRSLKQQ
ncbi:hypothetical protein FEDK69T_24080 [Flavobacterium enshiense DK69]|uniref:Chromosome segregation protein n=1 Tax=Flavobacterium enshiense DK69 TaxID=1107311 RepID=V6S6T8_9FLAO|nr:DUF349 domain-containing protein [Flavobacterium enshiense]ESU22418.1 hypothetical protein FEDK69T_24080 [Flavobacterium enshiense DK69]KGO97421.1 chromosome segregation protein [Flavobacterium enshiense DK69]